MQRRFTPAEQVLVDAISAYWMGFAAAGDPNAGAETAPDSLSLQRLRHPAAAGPGDLADQGCGAQLPPLGQDRLPGRVGDLLRVGQTPSNDALILGILIPFGNSEQSRVDGSGVYLTGQSRAGHPPA
jgi:hypothetical protein